VDEQKPRLDLVLATDPVDHQLDLHESGSQVAIPVGANASQKDPTAAAIQAHPTQWGPVLPWVTR